jgi:hypothetical protein
MQSRLTLQTPPNWDYPKMALWNDGATHAYFLTVNLFINNTTFVGVRSPNRASMLGLVVLPTRSLSPFLQPVWAILQSGARYVSRRTAARAETKCSWPR